MNEVIKTVDELEDALLVKLPAAGVDVDDVEVDIINGFVVITVPESEVADAYIITQEVDFAVSEDDIDLEIDNGVLSVYIYFPEFESYYSSQEYQAVQYLGDNLKEIVNFINKFSGEDTTEFELQEGDFLVNEFGYISIYTEEDFLTNFM